DIRLLPSRATSRRSIKRGARDRCDRPVREPSPRGAWQGHLAHGRRRAHRLLLDEKAIDELIISVAPVFIGDGIPLIARRHRHVPLELYSSDRFEDGMVQLHYRVQKAAV